jgi:hypothetical protein
MLSFGNRRRTVLGFAMLSYAFAVPVLSENAQPEERSKAG